MHWSRCCKDSLYYINTYKWKKKSFADSHKFVECRREGVIFKQNKTQKKIIRSTTHYQLNHAFFAPINAVVQGSFCIFVISVSTAQSLVIATKNIAFMNRWRSITRTVISNDHPKCWPSELWHSYAGSGFVYKTVTRTYIRTCDRWSVSLRIEMLCGN